MTTYEMDKDGIWRDEKGTPLLLILIRELTGVVEYWRAADIIQSKLNEMFVNMYEESHTQGWMDCVKEYGLDDD